MFQFGAKTWHALNLTLHIKCTSYSRRSTQTGLTYAINPLTAFETRPKEYKIILGWQRAWEWLTLVLPLKDTVVTAGEQRIADSGCCDLITFTHRLAGWPEARITLYDSVCSPVKVLIICTCRSMIKEMLFLNALSFFNTGCYGHVNIKVCGTWVDHTLRNLRYFFSPLSVSSHATPKAMSSSFLNL